MRTTDKTARAETITLSCIKVPILNIRMITDEEWNRLAYRNMFERQMMASGK